ncbi:MAG: hypothetical protein EON96_08325, partial [Caulobacteraceae bacterium]
MADVMARSHRAVRPVASAAVRACAGAAVIPPIPMRVCSLSSVRNRIVLGQPLPFSVRDAERMLLLARGQVIADADQLNALMKRGALVEVQELAESVQPKPVRTVSNSQRLAQMPAEWDKGLQEVRKAL